MGTVVTDLDFVVATLRDELYMAQLAYMRARVSGFDIAADYLFKRIARTRTDLDALSAPKPKKKPRKARKKK